ncbi:hypothetical protein BH11MYX3_BH11MYX3_11270 [soil metagenome]
MRATLLLILLVTGTAAAEGYDCPSRDSLGRCPSETTVPAGCPVHFLLASQPLAADIHATVMRAGQPVDVTGVATRTTVQRTVGTKNYYSCDCEEIRGPEPFDEYTLSLVGVAEGEAVTLSGPFYMPTTIAPAAACPAFTYTTDFYIPIACDLCPPGGPGGGGDDDAHDGGGCTAAPSSSSLLLGIVTVLALSRRGRSRRAAPRDRWCAGAAEANRSAAG